MQEQHAVASFPDPTPAFGMGPGNEARSPAPNFGTGPGNEARSPAPAFGMGPGNEARSPAPAFGTGPGNEARSSAPAFGTGPGNESRTRTPAFGTGPGNKARNKARNNTLLMKKVLHTVSDQNWRHIYIEGLGTRLTSCNCRNSFKNDRVLATAQGYAREGCTGTCEAWQPFTPHHTDWFTQSTGIVTCGLCTVPCSL